MALFFERERRRRPATHNGWGFVDELVIYKGFDHEKRKIHAVCQELSIARSEMG